MAAMVADPALRAAVFRFVDVRPACDGPDDVARHLGELLAEADESPLARRGAALAGGALTRRPVAAVAAAGVKQMARASSSARTREAALPTVAGCGAGRRDHDRPARRGDGHRGGGRAVREALRGHPARPARGRAPESPV